MYQGFLGATFEGDGRTFFDLRFTIGHRDFEERVTQSNSGGTASALIYARDVSLAGSVGFGIRL